MCVCVQHHSSQLQRECLQHLYPYPRESVSTTAGAAVAHRTLTLTHQHESPSQRESVCNNMYHHHRAWVCATTWYWPTFGTSFTGQLAMACCLSGRVGLRQIDSSTTRWINHPSHSFTLDPNILQRA